MTAASSAPIYLSLFLAGLAGSLHCILMCGPLILGFSRIQGSDGRPVRWSFLFYHLGRVWTYALMGLAAGAAGARLRDGAMLLGWQRPMALGLAILVLAGGLLALGWLPGVAVKLRLPAACWSRLGGSGLGGALLRQPHAGSRLLLGAVMGLLPCGLVYGALVVAATLPGPIHGALGMTAFGLGTVPALSALVLGGRWLPRRPWAISGERWAALVFVGVGLFMLARALWMPMH